MNCHPLSGVSSCRPPGNVPPSSVAIRGYRSVVGFLFAEFALLWVGCTLYLTWSDSLFRWPPNQNLRACILGTALALFILGSVLVWRRGGKTWMIVDDLGITLRRGRGTDFVPWSDVRYLLLVPVVIPERQHESVAAELYRILIATTAEPIELGYRVEDDGTPSMFPGEREIADKRAAVTLVMQRTGLPHLADGDSLRQREWLLAPEVVERRRRLWHMGLGLAALVCLGIACFIPIHDATHPPYRVMTGQVAAYERTSEQITVRLRGGSTEYKMFPERTWPNMPDALPAGTPVSMVVRGEDIGTFDASTPIQQWHVVTHGYAEPWTIWADDALWEFVLLYFLAAIAVILGRDIQRRRVLRKHAASSTSGER
jgi:hypothetical protein